MARDVRRQHIIDTLARTGRGRALAAVLAELEERLRTELLLPMPSTWLRAVAGSAAEGNPYVISAHTAHVSSVPAPDSPERPFGIG